MTRPRVDQATGDFLLEHVVQTCLVATNARVDECLVREPRFLDDAGIGQKWTGHAHHVCASLGQRVFAILRVVESVGRDQRNAHLAHESLGHKTKPTAWHHGGDGGNPSLVPSDAGVDHRGPRGFHDLRQCLDFLPIASTRDQVEHAEAVHHQKVGTDGVADAFDNGFRKAAPTLKVAAPSIVPVVCFCRHELVDQVPLRPHDFHPVVARFTRQNSAPHKRTNGSFHPHGSQCPGTEAANGRLDRRRSHAQGRVGITPGVQNLHHDGSPRLVHRACDGSVMTGMPRPGHAAASKSNHALSIRGDASGHNQSGFAFRAFGVKLGETPHSASGLFQPRVHAPHQDPIPQREESKVEGLKQPRIGVRFAFHAIQGKAHGMDPAQLSNSLNRLTKFFLNFC